MSEGTRKAGRALVWAGPWLAVGFLVWRQAGLERRMGDWVRATSETVGTMKLVEGMLAGDPPPVT